MTDAGYKTDQIIKILEDDTLALDLANGGAFSKEELDQFNAELAKTLKLNQNCYNLKLGHSRPPFFFIPIETEGANEVVVSKKVKI